MSSELIVNDDHDLDEPLTPEARTAEFKARLDELEEGAAELARRLRGLGDYRSVSTIQRSFQRMQSGEIAVSGEMMVIVKMLVNQQRIRNKRASVLEWNRKANGARSTTEDGFIINLNPETNSRWSVSLTHIETEFRPTWPRWQPSLEAAKRKAMTCLADGILEVHELAAIAAAEKK
ncbi:hypothetical protein [Rugamonas sp.]|uniref:hypothetical protein n=1 Tax=Rugamonas sp. TaxID=1926287 RepID=UPI0025E1519D|nr:hypothetical protein [Rugamonas sp.]